MTLRKMPPVQARDDLAGLDTSVVPDALSRWPVGVRAATEGTADYFTANHASSSKNVAPASSCCIPTNPRVD